MPKIVKGYHTAAGVTKEYDLFLGDLIEACAKWPGEWSRTAPVAAEAELPAPVEPVVPETPDAAVADAASGPVAPVIESAVPVPAKPAPAKGPGGKFQKKGS